MLRISWAKTLMRATKIVAKAIAVTPADIPAILKGDHIYSLADVQAAFDANSSTSVYQSASTISDFFVKENVIKQAPDIKALLNAAFVQSVSQNKK